MCVMQVVMLCRCFYFSQILLSENWKESVKKKDVLWLIETIKKLSIDMDDNANDLLMAHDRYKYFVYEKCSLCV